MGKSATFFFFQLPLFPLSLLAVSLSLSLTYKSGNGVKDRRRNERKRMNNGEESCGFLKMSAVGVGGERNAF